MRMLFILAIAIILTLCVQHGKIKAKVVRVIDGDTIVIEIDGKLEKVRLLGVDCPEIEVHRNKPFEYDAITNLTYLAEWGLRAKKFAEEYLKGKTVELEFDDIAGLRDRYGRLLAYVYVNGTDFNALLIERGLARVYIEGKFEKKNEYLELEKFARVNKIGLWNFSVDVTDEGCVMIDQMPMRQNLNLEDSPFNYNRLDLSLI